MPWFAFSCLLLRDSHCNQWQLQTQLWFNFWPSLQATQASLFLIFSYARTATLYPCHWRGGHPVYFQHSLHLYGGSVGRASDQRSFEACKLVVFPMIMGIFLHCIVLSALEDPPGRFYGILRDCLAFFRIQIMSDAVLEWCFWIGIVIDCEKNPGLHWSPIILLTCFWFSSLNIPASRNLTSEDENPICKW